MTQERTSRVHISAAASQLAVETALPGAAALLDAWEKSRGGELATRVSVMLGLVRPNAGVADLLQLPLGQRNRLLLTLHVALAGPKVECVVSCPHCGELNELSMSASALMLTPGATPPGGFALEVDAWNVRFRLPNTADLATALGQRTSEDMRRVVAERCLLSVNPLPPGDLPQALIDALSLAVGRADPAAEFLFDLGCVGCEQRFTTLLDPSYLVWRELNGAGRRLLAEVDALARVYHWPEREILSLSPARRAAYLAQVDA